MSLLAHSAGGWLARVYLLGFGTAGIDRLVTLGSPHQPPPKAGITPSNPAPSSTALVQLTTRSAGNPRQLEPSLSKPPAALKGCLSVRSSSRRAPTQAYVESPLLEFDSLSVALTGVLRAQEGVAFTVDQTRGILTHVTQTCPGRFHDEIEYITVAGKFIKGAGIREPGTCFKTQASLAPVQIALCTVTQLWTGTGSLAQEVGDLMRHCTSQTAACAP